MNLGLEVADARLVFNELQLQPVPLISTGHPSLHRLDVIVETKNL